MIEARLPTNEEARLAALRSYDILDTPAEEVFDDLTRVAARVCGTPIALVSLIDKDRQWFKSRVGLGATETPRSLAFCSHAILEPRKILVVEDSTRDPRFHDNDLVTGAPHVLFYAGAPLVTEDGMPLGTLCVIDNNPRTIDEESLDTLQSLARATVTQIELRKISKDLRHASRSLVESNEELKARNEEIRRFYQTLSHELKTPLTIVRDYVSMVVEGLAGEIDDEPRHFLSIAVENSDRLGRSIDDLLDLTRIDTCKFPLLPRTSDAKTMIESATNGLRPLAQKAGLTISSSIVEKVPPFLADPDRIVQVLNNLIRNAIKFTPEGGTIEVTAGRAATHPGSVEFSVRDSGRGIPQRIVQRVFERLYQCRDDDTSQQGLGLGLHLSREIVRLHGGEIEVESIEGEGSTFRFHIPIGGPGVEEECTGVPEERVT